MDKWVRMARGVSERKLLDNVSFGTQVYFTRQLSGTGLRERASGITISSATVGKWACMVRAVRVRKLLDNRFLVDKTTLLDKMTIGLRL